MSLLHLFIWWWEICIFYLFLSSIGDIYDIRLKWAICCMRWEMSLISLALIIKLFFPVPLLPLLGNAGIYSLILSLYFLSILARTVTVMFITFHLSLCFTGDSVMVTIETVILRLLDPIQEFIFRRLCGELQEVFSKSSRPVSVQLHRCPWWPTLTSARVLSFFFLTGVWCRASRALSLCPEAAGCHVSLYATIPQQDSPQWFL